MSNLRFAVLGTGFWSLFQIPAWREVGGVELVACYNRTVAKAEAVAAQFDIPRVYADPEELLRNETLDFVDIITEVPAHEPLVLLAQSTRCRSFARNRWPGATNQRSGWWMHARMPASRSLSMRTTAGRRPCARPSGSWTKDALGNCSEDALSFATACPSSPGTTSPS
ncbi:MAG: Gfo/Idh/MocA family oxidoreductase [Anaerolineales bacterium]|nr:Gfo/Idh/MocA family oxidoreductase [Anaerolineales bacterium]